MVELQSGDRSLFCSAMMTASRQVLAAAHDLATDAPVAETDFAPSWVDAFSTAPGALASFPIQGPYISATLIRAGQPLYQNSLKRPIAVHQGEMVTVLVKNGPVTVRAQLQAQSQAAVGDSATMINPSSGLPVAVTVTGPKTRRTGDAMKTIIAEILVLITIGTIVQGCAAVIPFLPALASAVPGAADDADGLPAKKIRPSATPSRSRPIPRSRRRSRRRPRSREIPGC